MRKFTTEHTVYKFEELSEEAQQKAIENNYDINVDYYWYYDEILEEIASDYGVNLIWSDLCFDLDRGSYLYMDNHDHGRSGQTSDIEDAHKFLKRAGLDLRTRDARELLDNGISLATKHYGGGDGRNYIDTNYADVSDETDQKLQNTIDELCDRLRTLLRDDYEYRTSEEAIRETLIENEYEFYEDGRSA